MCRRAPSAPAARLRLRALILGAAAAAAAQTSVMIASGIFLSSMILTPRATVPGGASAGGARAARLRERLGRWWADVSAMGGRRRWKRHTVRGAYARSRALPLFF